MASARRLVLAPAVLLLVFACGDSTPSVDADAGTNAGAPMSDASAEDVVAEGGPSCNGAAGQIACGATCVDPASDEHHCGTCEHACAADERCSAGACKPVCRIDGAVYAADAVDPTNACQVCTPATSTTAWTPRPAGTACGAGSVCSDGTCNAGCYIDGSYRASATLDPSNDCRACDPASSLTAWAVRPNYSACGTGQYCTAGACGSTWHGVTPNGLTAIYGGAVAAGTNGRIYLFGGVPVNVPTAFMQWYDPATNTFTRGADVPYASYRACAVTASNGKIYVMGGSPGGTAITNVVIYDPATNTYTNGPAMPFAADEDGCALGAGGKIFVFSADPAGAPPPALLTTARTMILDTVTGTWTSGAPMPTPRQRVTAITLPNGRIAVTGGNRGYIPGATSTANELYDPATNTWTTGAPMPALGYWHVAALRADGRIVVGNGLPFSGTWTATYVYDPTLDTWATGLPTAAGHYAGYAATTPDGRIYFLAGRTEGGGLTTIVDVQY